MWLAQKAEGVSAARPIWWACLHRGVLDVLLGITGAAAFPGLSSLNVLDELRLRPDISLFTEVCGIMFAVTSLLPNLVDYTMAAARNLASHVGDTRANLICLGLPYSLSWIFYFGSAFNILVNMTSTFLASRASDPALRRTRRAAAPLPFPNAVVRQGAIGCAPRGDWLSACEGESADCSPPARRAESFSLWCPRCSSSTLQAGPAGMRRAWRASGGTSRIGSGSPGWWSASCRSS